MTVLSRFSTPAMIVDFPDSPDLQAMLAQAWSDRVEGFTQQAIVGNPWNATNAANQTWYYDPTDTDVPDGTQAVLVSWFAFPNRLQQYLGANASPPNPYGYTVEQLLELGDGGPRADLPTGTGPRPKQVPSTLCPEADWTSPQKLFGPYGPRGWLDEYCEWSVVRNADGKITRVDFVCENPEYWYTLWSISPQAVADAYATTLNWGAPADQRISVAVEDLVLYDPSTGKAVIDPSTGTYAYNPLNKWNSGTVATRTGSPSDAGGAMHLTSTPNTLQTELGLAGAATVQRTIGNAHPQALICCSQYGQEYRHSDPHIGQGVNQAVSGPPASRVSLADPPGLYIQMPQAWARYQLPPDPKLPSGAQPSDCWQVVRGFDRLADPIGGGYYPGNFMLHVAFQLPQEWIDAGVSFTVGDITVNGVPIQYGGQIAQTFQIGLFPRPIPADPAPAYPCLGVPDVIYPQPLQLFFAELWSAYYETSVPNPVDNPISLASNTVIVPPVVEQGASGLEMALTCSGVTDGQAPAIDFPDGGFGISNVSEPSDVYYAVPGNSYPSGTQVVTFMLDVPADAEPGLWSIQMANPPEDAGEPAPAFLKVVAAGSVG